MSSPWLLPDYIADVLPAQAARIEELRRCLLDTARSYGYELVIPPLVEYLESLLTGSGQTLDLQTFKLVDQLSGRSLGVRADTTPQVARIDAHLLGRLATARLCYCGPVLHTRPESVHALREPLQLGAEIYGQAGREADLEILELAIDCLRAADIGEVLLDMSDTRIVRALLAGAPVDAPRLLQVHRALSTKDQEALAELTVGFPKHCRSGLLALVQLFGEPQTLEQAKRALSQVPGVEEPLAELDWLASSLGRRGRGKRDGVEVSFDLADARGYGYYTGMRFSVYAQRSNGSGGPAGPLTGVEIVRGGRYDGVGAVFGHKLDRDRPAVGFSLDLKQLEPVAPPGKLRRAIAAPWSEDEGLRQAIEQLRGQGQIVICEMPGQLRQSAEFTCDAQLVWQGGKWSVVPMA